jgi:hypothetical protein
MTWKEAYKKMSDIAGDAIGLAASYAGGESETAEHLNMLYEELDEEIFVNPPTE